MADSTGVQTFCGECGTRVRPGAAFCSSCGEPLSASEQSGLDNAESSPEPSAVASPVINGRPRQRWDSVENRPAASTSGAEEEQTVGSGPEFDYRDPVQSFIGAVRSIVTDPVGFFSGMARRGDYVNPLIFALICAEIYIIIGGLLGLLGALVGLGEIGVAFGSLFLGIVLAPIVGAIVLFVWAGVLHLLTVLIIKPRATGFETTFRVWSYSLTPVLLAWIPILGPIISGIWSTVLAGLGLREGHSTSTGKAAAVVLIPVAVMTLLSIILALIIWALILSVLSGIDS